MGLIIGHKEMSGRRIHLSFMHHKKQFEKYFFQEHKAHTRALAKKVHTIKAFFILKHQICRILMLPSTLLCPES
jgi:hypothetical protein